MALFVSSGISNWDTRVRFMRPMSGPWTCMHPFFFALHDFARVQQKWQNVDGINCLQLGWIAYVRIQVIDDNLIFDDWTIFS